MLTWLEGKNSLGSHGASWSVSYARTAVQGGGLRCFERLTAVVHRRAETGGGQIVTAVWTATLPFPALHRLCPRAV